MGPAHPFKTRQQLAKKNTLSGYVEPAHFDAFQFENQRRTFHSYGKENRALDKYHGELSVLCFVGYALDPTAMESAATGYANYSL